MTWVAKLSRVLARNPDKSFWGRDGAWLIATDNYMLVGIISDAVLDPAKREDGRADQIRRQAESFEARATTTLGELRAWLQEPPEDAPCSTCAGSARVRCWKCAGVGRRTCICDDCENEHDAECDCDGGYRGCGSCGAFEMYPSEAGSVGGVTINRKLLRGVVPADEDSLVVDLARQEEGAVLLRCAAVSWVAAVMPLNHEENGPRLPARKVNATDSPEAR